MHPVLTLHNLATTTALGMPQQKPATLGRTFNRPAPVAPSAPPPEASRTQGGEGVTVVGITDLVRYVRRYWKMGALLAIPLAALVFASLGFGKKVYEAEAQLLLRLQDSNVFHFEEMSSRAVTELSAPMLVNNHRTELRARQYMEYFLQQLTKEQRLAFIGEDLLQKKSWHQELREKIGLAEPPRPPMPDEIFISKLAKAVRVEPLKESHILRIMVRHTDPTVAALIANAYVDNYIRYVAEQELGTTRATSEYLEKKSDELLERLQKSEKELAEYRKAENLMQDSEVKDVQGEKVRLLTAALADAEVRLTKTRHELEGIKRAKDTGIDLLDIKIVATDPDVAMMRKQLEDKIALLAPLQADCGRNHPKVRAMNNEIEAVRTSLGRNIDSVTAMVEQEEHTISNQVNDLQGQLDEARQKVLAVSSKTVQQNLLRDQVAMDRELYQKIKLRMNQADLTGQFKDNGLLRVADVAALPDRPVKPSKTIAALASMMLFGLVFFSVPVGCGLYQDHLKPALRDADINPARPQIAAAMELTPVVETAALPQLPEDTPHVAALPEAPPQATQIAMLPEIQADSPSALLQQLMRPGANRAAAELQQITAALEKRSWTRKSPGVLLVTSAGSGEGKSVLSTALASCFCSQGKKVFLMECNPASPCLDQWLPNVKPGSAWASDLESLRYADSNLFVLPARDLPSDHMKELVDGYVAWIDRARKTDVDWIILDAAPVLKNFADVAPLAEIADDIVFVHDSAISSSAQVKAANSLLKPITQGDIVRGLVLNRQGV